MAVVPRTYRSKLAGIGGLVIVLFFGVAYIDWHMGQRMQFYQLRMQLAHSVHQEYLLLSAQSQLVRTLEQSIDLDFKPQIENAIVNEAAEAADAVRAANDLLVRQNRIVQGAGGAAILSVIAVLFALRRDFRSRIEQLEKAIRSLTSGNLDYRLAVENRDEFTVVARGFNHMAAELQRKQAELKKVQDKLEERVDETAKELVAANAALRRHDTLRQQFMEDISHELRTPVTVIRGEAQFALRSNAQTGEEYRQVLERIQDQALQLGRLVDDLLYIARSRAGVASPQRKLVVMQKLLDAVCRDARIIAAERDVAVFNEAALLNVRVLGDEGRLRQLIPILMENAVLYSGVGGRVDVNLETDNGEAILVISDNGAGIAPQEQERVMERFYRGTNAAATNAAGSGLGLPVAKAIVVAHGGQIWLDSQQGKGTQVTVKLPLAGMVRAVQ